MGHSILEYVLRLLRQERFAADVAYPGQKFPRITDPVAAVHIEKVDRANMTVTVEISIIVPAAQAELAMQILRDNGQDSYIIGSIVRNDEEKVILE